MPLHKRLGKARNRMGLTWPVAVFLCLLATGSLAATSPDPGPEVLRIRHFTGPDYTRVVLDLSRPCSFEVRELASQRRLAVNVRQGKFRLDGSVPVNDGLIKRIRCNPGPERAQVVLDLDHAYAFKSFSLPAQDGRPDRVVVDVFRRETKLAQIPEAESEPQPELRLDRDDNSSTQEPSAGPADPVPSARDQVGQPFTIVIDPGHGGLDPGAIRGKIREKDVVLDLSREMVRLIDELPGYQAVLTRDTDHYPSLGKRVSLARESQGDLFLSIHCNTHRKKSVSGMEVYFLSLQGATDREARELADKENAADMVGLDTGKGHDDLVMNILMDLKMSRVLHESSRLADHLLAAADRDGTIHGRKAKQARFQVLRNLAMPSALVEVAYLSNGKDRKVLSSSEGRRRMAATLVEGVLAWQRDGEALALLGRQIPDSWTRKYAVRRGDSLWDLAKKHGTTVVEIERRNQLRSRSIMVGQVLNLPDGVPAR